MDTAAASAPALWLKRQGTKNLWTLWLLGSLKPQVRRQERKRYGCLKHVVYHGIPSNDQFIREHDDKPIHIFRHSRIIIDIQPTAHWIGKPPGGETGMNAGEDYAWPKDTLWKNIYPKIYVEL